MTSSFYCRTNLGRFLRLGPKRFGLERSVAHLQILPDTFVGPCFVKWLAQLLAQHDMRWRRHLAVKSQCIAQSHHLQSHSSDLEIDLDSFRRYVSNAFDQVKTLID